MSEPLLVPEPILRDALRKAYLIGYRQGLKRASLIGTIDYNGRHYFVGDGVMAATVCKTEEDVLEFNRRYAAAQTEEEQIATIRDVIDWTVKTR